MKIDLHCHLLWDMDDGAATPEESWALCENAVRHDIRIIAATPHFTDFSKLDDFLYVRNRRLHTLREKLGAAGLPLDVCGGAEVFLHEGVYDAGDLSPLTLNHSRYLLCEFSLRPFDPSIVLPLTEEIFDRGLVPVIAHPERYPTFHRHPALVSDLADMGALFQITADSLTGVLGGAIQNFALQMLLDGTADLIATDAHHPVRRSNALNDMLAAFPASLSAKAVAHATLHAPARVLQNADPAEVRRGA